MPLVIPLVRESRPFCLVESGEVLEAVWVAGHKSSLAKEVGMLGHTVRLGECATIVGGSLC